VYTLIGEQSTAVTDEHLAAVTVNAYTAVHPDSNEQRTPGSSEHLIAVHQ